MTDPAARIASAILFVLFSAFGLWFLDREYRRLGRLNAFAALVHVAIFAVQAMFTMVLLWGPSGRMPPPGPAAWAGIPLMLLGLGLTLAAMDWFRAFPRWLGSRTPGLRERGLYRFSRNPQFVGYGLFLLGSGITWWNARGWVVLLGYAVLVGLLARVEEAHLARVYGEAYRAYCARVPRFLGRPAPKSKED